MLQWILVGRGCQVKAAFVKVHTDGSHKTLARNSQPGYVMRHESCYRKGIAMLQTIEAIIEPSGAVRLLEEVHFSSPKRALVTVLETPVNDAAPERGNAAAILKFLKDNPLPPECRRSAEEIDAGIEAERNAWD
jgi:hypothetical protein